MSTRPDIAQVGDGPAPDYFYPIPAVEAGPRVCGVLAPSTSANFASDGLWHTFTGGLTAGINSLFAEPVPGTRRELRFLAQYSFTTCVGLSVAFLSLRCVQLPDLLGIAQHDGPGVNGQYSATSVWADAESLFGSAGTDLVQWEGKVDFNGCAPTFRLLEVITEVRYLA